ncbi:FAD-binding oxidoreductase [Legionella gresilensis]|uniref:FAD-binding oxidoreductase n=1 Tax=Legionella gresilensis TaxID=91823 RepID=UPI001041ABDF|nr:FAD-binding oxidoreductase [Legionella gresilensis]
MPELHYNNQRLSSMENESVLDCLLRYNISYPHSCRSGICQACLVKATDNKIEPTWQEGLPDTLKTKGYFLACQAKPTTDLYLKAPAVAECDQQALITEITKLTYNVIRVRLLAENLQDWIPGQYLNLINPHGLSRSYSIANMPANEGYIEIHIKLKDDGEMSRWFQKKAAVDTIVQIRGPFGTCYYINPDKVAFDILLVGTGTGLAPLLAIAKSALSEQHNGKITLIHGGCQDDDIYYAEELETLASWYPNFVYIPCVLKTSGRYLEANVLDKTQHTLTNLKNIHVYICGPKEITSKLKTNVFLAGVPSTKIYSDSFF